MAEFINYIIDSPIQPVKTNVLWVKKGVLHYYNKKWIPIAGGGSGNITSPIIDGEGNYSAVLAYSDNKALNISSIALGYNNISRNFAEASFGKYNLSHESDDPSIATLFSIGNGSEEERKNAFEVKEDGEIYIGKRTESLQTILYNLENYFLNDKYDILEQQLSDLDAYSRSNIEALKELIKANKLDLQNYKEYVEEGFLKMSTSITQTAEEIRLEASKIEERLNGRITESESSFSITAEEIRAEVSRVETDLDGKITKSNSLISQTADEIRTEVSRVELDINGSIREANSRITQTAEEIKSEVYDIQTTLDGKINENSSKIEQTSEEIKSSVKLEQFNALTGAVDQGFTEVKQSVEGIITTIGDRTGKTTSITEDIDGVTVSLGTVEADIESLKKQSDGAIDTHFGTVAPTLDNEPAVNWDTEELKKEHTGDLYYNNTTGEAFRWSYDPETETYLWVELTDSALTEALDKISKLEEAINGKVTIFYSKPSNYKEGDLWFVHIDYPSYHFIEGQLLTAIAASDAFDASHWEDKTNFASHAEVTESVTQLNNYIDGAFSDNILTVAEIKQIKEAKKNFESLFSEVKESYSYLVISAAATESDKTALTEAYNNLTHEINGSYTLLIAAIDALIALDKEEGDDVLDIGVVKGLLAEYESAYELFSKDLTAYYAASAKLTEGIQNYLSSASDYINDVMSDNVLSPIEKEQLLNIWRQIAEEFTANRGIAYNYKLLSISDTEEYIKRTDIYPEDSPYHSIYEAYENAYNVVKNIFTAVNEEGKNIWGFDDLSVSTATPEDLTTVYISESLDAYYKTLSPFAEMIAEITIAITDAHEAAKEYVSKLANHLDPKDEISVIGKGVILSSIIGVKKSDDDTFISAINAQALDNEDISTVDETHGRVVYAGGIPSSNNWNDSTTVIYEDGHVKFKSGEISDFVSIGETRQAILNKANTLQESLGVGGNTVIDGGLVLSTLLGVVDTEGNLKSVLNASDISKDTVTGHGRIVFAGGIQDSEDWTTAKTLIYEDGYVHFKWGEIDDAVEIGNALVTAISSGNIDLFSYPETVNGVTTLVPLFQVTKDETGKIIAVHSVYDFYANKDLTTLGETSSGGIGEYNPVAGTVTGIIIDTTPYYPNEAGIIDLTDAFEAIGGSGIDVTQLEAYLTSNNYINSVNGIISMLGYTPANNASLANYLPLTGGTIASSGVSPLGIKTTRSSSPASYITIYGASDNVLGYMGYSYSSGMFMQHSGGNYIAVTSTGVIFNDNTLIHSGNIGSYNAGSAWALRINEIANVNDSITQSFFMAGFQAANRPDTSQNYSTGITLHNNTLGYTYQLAYSTSNALYSRRKTATGWEGWKQLAFTDSNVASATKLATARTIWGQSFDGTGNVKGGLTAVQNIDFESNNLHDVGSNSRQARYIYAGWLGSQTGKTLSFGANNGTHMLINTTGNVGIGTTNPAYKLDVNGTASFSGAVSVGNANSSTLKLLRSGYHSYIIGSSSLAFSINGNNNNIALALWEDKSASFAGAVTMSSTLDVTSAISIGSNSGAALYLARNSANYIWSSVSGGYMVFGCVDRGSTNTTNASLLVHSYYVSPGYSNGIVDLGHQNYRWKKLHCVDAAFSGAVTMSSTLSIADAINSTHASGLDITACNGAAAARVFLTNGAFRPWLSDNGLVDLGISGARWKGLYCKTGDFSGAVTMTSTLTVSQKLQCNKPIFGYMYSSNNNAAAFIFDKPGSNYTGIGSDGTSNTIRLSACNDDGGWVDYAQKWKFYGDIIVTGDVASA